jgi:hypothetical protein
MVPVVAGHTKLKCNCHLTEIVVPPTIYYKNEHPSFRVLILF